MIQSRPVTRGARYSPRRRALQRHGAPLALAAFVAFGGGAVLGAQHTPAEQDAAEQYVQAWEDRDYAAMHALLSQTSQKNVRLEDFVAAHERAAATSTGIAVIAGEPGEPRDDTVAVPLRVRTKMFGLVRRTLVLPFTEEDGEARIAWDEHLTFPGVRRGEELTRETRLPPRATLTAADGTVLAKGEDRAAADTELAASIRGEMGPIPEERREELRAKGVPSDARVGISGLERALDDELRGKPGGVLLAGGRALAQADPVRAKAVRS